MKKRVEEIVMDFPVFFEEIPEKKLNSVDKKRREIKKRDGETVMLLDRNILDKNHRPSTYFLCRIKIDPKDAELYTVQVPLDNSKKERFWESKLRYDRLERLMVKTAYSGYLFSRKYRNVSE